MELAAGARSLAVPPEIVADFLASAFLALVHSWLDHGWAYTPEQMETFFQQLVMSGARRSLRVSARDEA